MRHCFRAHHALLAATLAFAAAAPGCSTRKTYPDSPPGWHSAGYHTVFGRLQRIAAKDPDSPPLWIIRYGFRDGDKYAGRFNLTPASQLTGYSGDELVQITGSIHPEMSNPNAPGTWYVIDSIRLWSGQAQR